MPGARISFTCSTAEDGDLIEWLDSFGVRERGFAIKAALRDYIVPDDAEISPDLDRLSKIEDQMSDIFRELVEIRKQGLAQSINNDIINTDLYDQNEVDPQVESNIGKLFED